jgi:uroporphyrinogen-III synthase
VRTLKGASIALLEARAGSGLSDVVRRYGGEPRLYECLLPEHAGPLGALITDVTHGRVDAVAFTSKVQCRHLFLAAAQSGREEELAAALNDRTTVAVIGPVCRAALRAHGVVSRVMPATPKMAPLVAAIAEYFDLSSAEL